MSVAGSSSVGSASTPVRLTRFRDGAVAVDTDAVLVEQPVTLMVEDLDDFALFCTPADLEALAVGFLFAEGLIESVEDLAEVQVTSHVSVKIRVKDLPEVSTRRNLLVTSSCGLCGTRNVSRILHGTPPCSRSLQVTPEVLFRVAEEMSSRQELFRSTGGAHAAALFSASGEVFSFAEDLGRHSALDKAVGRALLAGRPTPGSGVLLSGRTSFEMVLKAARAGIELVAAVSAPSSLAVTAAARWEQTLCGFHRPSGFNLYTHPERVLIHGVPA
jgi:FdhD protein